MYPLLPRNVMVSSFLSRDQSGQAPIYFPFTMLMESIFSLARPDSACNKVRV